MRPPTYMITIRRLSIVCCRRRRPLMRSATKTRGDYKRHRLFIHTRCSRRIYARILSRYVGTYASINIFRRRRTKNTFDDGVIDVLYYFACIIYY